MVGTDTREDNWETRKPSVTKKKLALKSWSTSSLVRWIWKPNREPDSEETWGSKRKIKREAESLAAHCTWLAGGVSSPATLCCHRPKQNCAGHEAGAQIGNTPSGRPNPRSQIQGTRRQDREKLTAAADENTNRKTKNFFLRREKNEELDGEQIQGSCRWSSQLGTI
jgi:hypothetical protein